MKILGIIPARSGSKRLPNKNILPIAGKPLVQHTMEMAVKSTLLDFLVVNSDSDLVLKVANLIEGIIPIRRPAELAKDTSPAIEYVEHSLNYMRQNYRLQFDVVVIIQATSPFTLTTDLDQTIQLLLDTKADSAVSVCAVDHMIHPFKLKRMEGDHLIPFLEAEKGRMAAHELPKVFVRNGAVYVSTIETIQSKQIIGADCRGYLMPKSRSIDINDEIDFAFAQFLFQTSQKN